MNTISRVLHLCYQALSSKVFLIWLVGGWIVYYVLSAIWMNESFAHFAMGLQKGWLLRVPYVLFLVSGYLNLIRAFRGVLGKGRIQALLWMVLPLGVMFFSTAYFLSLGWRQFNWMVVGEGHDVTPSWSSERYSIGKIKSGLKERVLDMDMNAGKGVFQYEPTVNVVDSYSRNFSVGAFPARRIGNSYFHILNFGLAPGVRISEGDTVKEEGYMPLKILGGGSSDTFEVQPYPYRFTITFESDRTIRKGDLKASEYNFKNPLYSVRVFKGEKIIAEGTSREPVRFENLSLTFSEPVTWIQIEVVKDLGYPLLVFGIFLITAGIPCSCIRLLWLLRGSKVRGEISASPDLQ